MLGTLSGRRQTAAKTAVAQLEGMTPSPAQADDHTTLRSVFVELVAIERELVEAYAVGALGVLAADGPEVAAWVANVCRLVNELSPEGVAWVVAAMPAEAGERPPPGAPANPFAGVEKCFAEATAG